MGSIFIKLPTESGSRRFSDMHKAKSISQCKLAPTAQAYMMAKSDTLVISVYNLATGSPSERCPPPPPPPPRRLIGGGGGGGGGKREEKKRKGVVLGYRTKLLRIPPGSFTCFAYNTVTWDLRLASHPKDNS